MISQNEKKAKKDELPRQIPEIQTIEKTQRGAQEQFNSGSSSKRKEVDVLPHIPHPPERISEKCKSKFHVIV